MWEEARRPAAELRSRDTSCTRSSYSMVSPSGVVPHIFCTRPATSASRCVFSLALRRARATPSSFRSVGPVTRWMEGSGMLV